MTETEAHVAFQRTLDEAGLDSSPLRRDEYPLGPGGVAALRIGYGSRLPQPIRGRQSGVWTITIGDGDGMLELSGSEGFGHWQALPDCFQTYFNPAPWYPR